VLSIDAKIFSSRGAKARLTATPEELGCGVVPSTTLEKSALQARKLLKMLECPTSVDDKFATVVSCLWYTLIHTVTPALFLAPRPVVRSAVQSVFCPTKGVYVDIRKPIPNALRARDFGRYFGCRANVDADHENYQVF
jgi:hypothetical protein